MDSLIALLPERAKPYARLMRLDKPVGTGLALWPALWGICLASMQSGTHPDAGLIAICAIGAFVMRSAGCVVNDMWDSRLDAQVARTRTRPLASGAVTHRQALQLLIALLLVGAVLLLRLPAMAIGIGLCAVPLIILYPAMKRITYWPQLMLGFTFNLGVLIGYAAQSGGALSLEAGMLYVACIFWTLGYDTIYALQDVADDKKAGIRSTARLFADKTPFAVAMIYDICITLLCMVAWLADFHALMWVGVVAFALSLGWQVMQLVSSGEAIQAGMLFRSNALAGCIVFLFWWLPLVF